MLEAVQVLDVSLGVALAYLTFASCVLVSLYFLIDYVYQIIVSPRIRSSCSISCAVALLDEHSPSRSPMFLHAGGTHMPHCAADNHCRRPVIAGACVASCPVPLHTAAAPRGTATSASHSTVRPVARLPGVGSCVGYTPLLPTSREWLWQMARVNTG